MQKTDAVSEPNRIEEFFKKNKKIFSSINYIFLMIGIIIFLLIILEFASFLVLHYSDSKIDEKNYREIYSNAEWINCYLNEYKSFLKMEYSPYVEYRSVPNFKGEYINTDNNSIRKTFAPCAVNLNKSNNSIKIFIFGGSTIWGEGSRDFATIPSFVLEDLCLKGYDIIVTNFGEPSYTNSQEMIRLILELRKGNIPDIVVFYDGYNDVYSSYQNKLPGVPQNYWDRERDYGSRNKHNLFPSFSRIKSHIIRSFQAEENTEQDNYLINKTVFLYLNNLKVIKSLGNQYHFETLFYWQPTLYNKKFLTQSEINKKYSGSLKLAEYYIKYTDLLKNSTQVVNIANIFNSQNNTLFLDDAHISERGNQIVAEEISKDIVIYLKDKTYFKQ